MDNATIGQCANRSGEATPVWDGQLFAKLVMPFTDMTVKGWAWYQGIISKDITYMSTAHNNHICTYM
jgi:hypothetical protein